MAPGMQFLVSPVLYFLAVVCGPSFLAPHKEMVEIWTPRALLPVAGTAYRALGAHSLSLSPSLSPSLLVLRRGYRLGILGVAKPIRWDGHHRPE